MWRKRSRCRGMNDGKWVKGRECRGRERGWLVGRGRQRKVRGWGKKLADVREGKRKREEGGVGGAKED